MKIEPAKTHNFSKTVDIPSSEYNILREPRNPVLILADKRAVVEATEKIKKEKYSKSS